MAVHPLPFSVFGHAVGCAVAVALTHRSYTTLLTEDYASATQSHSKVGIVGFEPTT